MRKPEEESPSALLARGQALVARTIDSLEVAVERNHDKLVSSERYDDKAGSHASYLLGNIAVGLREIRQLSQHAGKIPDGLTPDQEDEAMLAWFRDLPAERRARVFADLQQAHEHAARSVL